jgi:hypothetical protein
VITDALTDPTVKAAIEALQKGDRRAWSALFESDARLYDDGAPRSLAKFTREALGHERFTSIDQVENVGLDLVGRFHSDSGAIFGPTSGFASRLRARSRGWTSGRRTTRTAVAGPESNAPSPRSGLKWKRLHPRSRPRFDVCVRSERTTTAATQSGGDSPSARNVCSSSAIGLTSTQPIHAPGILVATWIASFMSLASMT